MLLFQVDEVVFERAPLFTIFLRTLTHQLEKTSLELERILVGTKLVCTLWVVQGAGR